MAALVNSEAFQHAALLYADDSDYLAQVSAFVRAGLAPGDPVLAAVPAERAGPLREVLGPAGRQVGFLDMTKAGRNPGRLIAAMRGFADSHPGRRVSAVGEPAWPVRSAGELRATSRSLSQPHQDRESSRLRLLRPCYERVAGDLEYPAHNSAWVTHGQIRPGGQGCLPYREEEPDTGRVAESDSAQVKDDVLGAARQLLHCRQRLGRHEVDFTSEPYYRDAITVVGDVDPEAGVLGIHRRTCPSLLPKPASTAEGRRQASGPGVDRVSSTPLQGTCNSSRTR